MSLSKNLKSSPAPIAAKATTQTRSQRAANHKSGISNQRVPKALPTFEGVEILQYVENGPSPNYSTWIEQLALAVEQRWPDLSWIFSNKDFSYWEPPTVKLPTAEEEAADAEAGGYQRAQIKAKLIARQTRLDKMESDKIPCFAFIMKTVSEESKEGVAKIDKYDVDVKNSRNPSLLMEAFELTHSTKFSANSTIMMLNVEDQYMALKQHSNESLLLYKRRIESTLCMYDAIDMVRPSHATIVNNMLKTVNTAKYEDAIKELLTAVRENVKPFPATTQELYVYLVGRVPDNRGAVKQDYVVDSAFVTIGDQMKNSGGKKSADNPKKPTRDCNLCPKHLPSEDKKHWQADCPYLERFHQSMEKEAKTKKQVAFAATDESNDDEGDSNDSAWVTLSETVVAAVANGHLKKRDVLFDCAATVSIINNVDLLTDIRPLLNPRVITGVGGNATIKLYGILPVVGRVLYSPSFPVSVISHSKVRKCTGLEVDYLKNANLYTVENTATGAVLKFLPRRGLYVCEFPHLDAEEKEISDVIEEPDGDSDDEDPNIFATTADQNKLLYTKREVFAADAARELVKSLAYPSMADMFTMIKSGISGSSVTARDLHRALAIYGPFIPSIQGKTTRRKTPLVYEDVPRSVVTEQVLHADLLFVDKAPFLISVSKPLGLTIASHLRNGRGATSMRKAMIHQIHQYTAQGFKIKTLVFDGEGAIEAIEADIAALGTKLERVPPGAHVGVVERKNQVIKERFRAIKSGLWFTLPLILIPWLVYFCVSRINMLPSRGNMDLTSPRENFTGRKVDFKRDLRMGFGDYVHVHEDRVITNTTQPRTEEALCLLPLSNLAGSAQFLSLKTLKVISRSNYTRLPVVPDTTLERINSIAAADNAADVADMVPAVVEEAPAHPAIDARIDMQPLDGEGVDIPVLVQPVHVPPELTDPTELMTTDDHPYIADHPDDHEATTASTVAEERRYPTRSNRTSYKDPDRVYNITVKKALNAHGKKALRSIYTEIKQMPDKKVFTPQDPRKLTKCQLRKAIMSTMFLKEKFLSNGDFEKLKARLVAGGHQQDKTAYGDISSPTVATSSAFMIASLAALEKRHVVTVDIAGAYLNADMTGDEVLMKLDSTMTAILIKIRPNSTSLNRVQWLYVLTKRSMVVLRVQSYGMMTSREL